MHKYEFKPENYKNELLAIFEELSGKLVSNEFKSSKDIDKTLKKYPKDKSEIFSRDKLIAGFKWLSHENLLKENEISNFQFLISKLKLKPMRTESGVTTVTVLTKPYFCPGNCVFCPNDVRMPKSYIATEPGAQRALANRFSPYLQTWNRLQAIKNIGHPTNKIELLVLGGTWSSYPEKYQVWFIKECFRAMNEFRADENSKYQASNSKEHRFKHEGSEINIKEYLKTDYNDSLRRKLGKRTYNTLVKTEEFKKDFEDEYVVKDPSVGLNFREANIASEEEWNELFKLQDENSRGVVRCVGLVLETRPDSIIEKEAWRLRKLGATKIQLGIQTLNDNISRLNKRGEGLRETSKAFRLLRLAGFKIHAHIMPNLLGATPEIDMEVWQNLFTLLEYKPDEVKIYPTSVIKNTELYERYQKGEYSPYTTNELIDLIAFMMSATPEYCRLTRIIRDIPSTEIEVGNKTTNLREVVEWKLKKEGLPNPNIRAREIKNKKVTMDDLSLDILEYETDVTTECFLQYITSTRQIAGFLRLSLPKVINNEELKINNETSPRPSPIGEGEALMVSEVVSQDISAYHNPITSELDNCAMIREIHVYGPSLQLSKGSEGEAQHLGLGTKLIEKAKEMAIEKGFNKLAVISSIGTREYYLKRGFELKEFYQIADL